MTARLNLAITIIAILSGLALIGWWGVTEAQGACPHRHAHWAAVWVRCSHTSNTGVR